MTSAHPGVSARTVDKSMLPGTRPCEVVVVVMRSTFPAHFSGDDGTLPIGAHVSHRFIEIAGTNGPQQRAMLLRRCAARLDALEVRELDALQPLGEPDDELRQDRIARAIDDD